MDCSSERLTEHRGDDEAGDVPGGKQDGPPLPPPSGDRDLWCPLLRAVRPRAGGVLRHRRDVAQLRNVEVRKAGAGHMTLGRVLWYCDEIGYGFIYPDEGRGKLLVPRRGIDASGPRSLENGAKVTYEAIQG